MIHFLKKNATAFLLFFLPWGSYFFMMWSHMFTHNEKGLFAGHPWVWADWGLHVALTSAFAYKPPALWIASYPLFSGARLTYPFMTNLISGLLVRMGFTLTQAFILPSYLLTALILIILYAFFYSLFRSQFYAAVAGAVFFCSGGLGLLFNVVMLGAGKTFFDSTVINSAVSAAGIEVNNITASMIFPQRAYLLGLPMGIFIFFMLVRTFVNETKISGRVHRLGLVAAGVLAGVLPITHTHTFIVIVCASIWFFAFSFRRIIDWLWYGVPAVLISSLVFLQFFYGNLSGGAFFTVHPGWYVQSGFVDWFVFWIKNWGLFWIGSIIGTLLLAWKRDEKQLQLVSFFWFLFLFANMVKFQPQLWDNTKVFAWVYFGLCIPFVVTIRALIHNRWSKFGGSILAGVLLLLTVGSGLIDVVHNLDFEQKTFQMLSSSQIELGIYVRDHVPANAVILTTDSVDNPVAMMSGRSVLLGYAGWMLNFGLPYAQRQVDLPIMYKYPEESTVLFDRYSIGYIVVSESESQYHPGSFETPQFQKLFANDYGVLYKRL